MDICIQADWYTETKQYSFLEVEAIITAIQLEAIYFILAESKIENPFPFNEKKINKNIDSYLFFWLDSCPLSSQISLISLSLLLLPA